MSAMPERRPREPRESDGDERLRQFLQWREETGRARQPRPRSSFPFVGAGFVLTLIALGVAWWTSTSGLRHEPVAVNTPAPVSTPTAPEPPAPAPEVAAEPAASPVTPEPSAEPAPAEPVVSQLAAPAAEIALPVPPSPSEDAAPAEPAPELPPRKGKRFAVDRVPAGPRRAPLTPLASPPATRDEATESTGAASPAERAEPAPTIDLPPRRAPAVR